MQTFLPVPDFWGSATLLDRGRLGKQRLETMQIMQALTGLRCDDGTGEPVPHPAPPSVEKHWVTALWRGHELALWRYQREVVREWVSRGYRDACWAKTDRLFRAAGMPGDDRPPWLGDEEFHAQHRARLVAKDPGLYGPLFPGTAPIDDYDFKWRNS